VTSTYGSNLKAVDKRNLMEAASIVENVDAASLRKHLSSVFGGRNRFTANDKITQVENYIFEKFEEYGWKTEKQICHFEAFESHDKKSHQKTNHDIAGANVIATKPGKNPGKIILIGAHYDTVNGSPGADDNGTGVAALLEVARVLGGSKFSKTLVLAAFDMEETGLAGSRAFIDNIPPDADIEDVIIVETVGFMSNQEHTQMIPKGFSILYREQVGKIKENGFKGDFITVIYGEKSKRLVLLLDEMNKYLNTSLKLVFVRDPLGIPVLGRVLKLLFPGVKDLFRSDHVPFWQKGISAVQLTDSANFRNPHYHQPTDTIETIDFDSVQKLVQTVTATAAILAQIE
jgi:hypothetical protein